MIGSISPGRRTLDATQVREIEINWLDGSVTVETHTGEGIVLEETGAGAEEEDQLHWRLEEGELTIQYRASRFLTMSGDDKQLRVLVPEGWRSTRSALRRSPPRWT